VDLHKGSIEMDSAPGRGTTFTVRLKMFRDTTAATRRRAKSAKARKAQKRPAKRR